MNSEKSAAFLDHAWIWFLLLSQRFILHVWMQWWTVFTDNTLQKCLWVNAVISIIELCVFNAVPPEDLIITAIQYWFLNFSLAYRNLSGFSESFNDTMYCTCWNLQILCNITLSIIIPKSLHYLPTWSFTEWWTAPRLHLLPINLISCEILNQVLCVAIIQLLQCSVAPS